MIRGDHCFNKQNNQISILTSPTFQAIQGAAATVSPDGGETRPRELQRRTEDIGPGTRGVQDLILRPVPVKQDDREAVPGHQVSPEGGGDVLPGPDEPGRPPGPCPGSQTWSCRGSS